MQNIIDFIINNKIIVISIFILIVCIIIGFFGNRRLESKKNSISSDNDTKKSDVLQSTEIIDADLNMIENNPVLNNHKKMYSDASNEPNNLITNEVGQNYIQNTTIYTDLDNNLNTINSNVSENVQNNLNNSTITSDFFIPDDNDINNIF